MRTRLVDKYKRSLNYLRISVTDRCNLRCRYCTPLTPDTMLSHNEILRYEEILKIVKVGAKLGINKVRVTGGEPLVRHGICDFLADLGEIDELIDISLTTNGVLLSRMIDDIKAAGIKRINISLDSLTQSGFKEITGRDHYHRVWEGIEAALDRGFHPIKINVVAIPGMNDHELTQFAELSIQYPFHVRFIEYMPIGHAKIDRENRLLTPEIKERIASLGELIPIEHDKNDGPAFRYKLPNAKGEVGFISPISNHFCATCNRLRLTANGNLRTCLLSDQQIDMRHALRRGASDDEIAEIFFTAMEQKQQRHNLTSLSESTVHTQMSSIGG